MPRVSANERSMAIIPGKKMPPPDYLGDEECQIWDSLTAQMDDDRVNDVGAQILLPLLVSHMQCARELHNQIAALKEAGAWGNPTRLRILRQLMRDQAQETGMIIAVARSLRFTAQSKRYDSSDMQTANTPRPWEDWRGGRG